MTPGISILLPAFAAQRTIASALCSIQRQTECDWECIVVDDGSRDATRSIVLQFVENDPRVRLLTRPHEGLVGALQVGLRACRAPLIARFDADDLMSRRRLEVQRRTLEQSPELVAVGCHIRFFPRASLQDGLHAYERWLCSIRTPDDVKRESMIECPLAHPSLLVRRDVLAEFGYRDRGWPEDYDLVLRLLEAGLRVGVVPERLLHWRDGSSRLSRTSSNYSIAAFVECKAEFLARGFLTHHDHYILWGYGDTGKSLARALARRGKRPAAIIEVHPRRLGQFIAGVPVVAPAALAFLDRMPVVVSVAGLGPRTEIRDALARIGFSEMRDFVCAA